MPVPRLLHPINVTIRPISKATTIYDEDAREPIGTATHTTAIVVPAQIKWRVPTEPSWDAIGAVEDVRGYILMLWSWLTSHSYTPKRGDEITAIGSRSYLLYFTQLDDLVHYPNLNGPAFRRAYFGDRRPATEQPSM